MGQNDELVGIFCIRDTPIFPKLKGSRLNKLKVFTYIAIIICFCAAFAVNIIGWSIDFNMYEAQNHIWQIGLCCFCN